MDERTTAIPFDMLRAYRQAFYEVLPGSVGHSGFFMKIDEPNEALLSLMNEYAVRSAAFLTAWNPFSELTSAAANEAEQARLLHDIDLAGHATLPALARDPTERWPDEPSVLVLGIERDAACALALRYRQNALLYINAGAIPRLVLLR